MYTEFLSKNLKGRDHSKNLGVHGMMIILKWNLGKQGRKLLAGFI